MKRPFRIRTPDQNKPQVGNKNNSTNVLSLALFHRVRSELLIVVKSGDLHRCQTNELGMVVRELSIRIKDYRGLSKIYAKSFENRRKSSHTHLH